MDITGSLTFHSLRTRSIVLALALAALMTVGVGIAHAEKVVFVDWSWDSAQVHNRVAGLIIQHGYGYDVDYIFADTMPGLQGMRRGDIDVSMEMWTDNFAESWDEALARGEIVDLGPNFPDAPQGWYVPTYMIEGDPARGIEPIAPDLRSVTDLPKYWELFTDREQPNRGRFYNAPTGWVVHDINNAKLKGYGLLDTFVAFSPGSQSALDASIAGAYRRGLPWVGYYWEPSGIMGMFDMTMLEEPPYTDECWVTDYACTHPAASVRVAVHGGFVERAPEVIKFLKKYETTLDQTNVMVMYLETEARGRLEEAAAWFLKEYEDVWTDWVPEDVANKVKARL